MYDPMSAKNKRKKEHDPIGSHLPGRKGDSLNTTCHCAWL
jgi:hypothetical protein